MTITRCANDLRVHSPILITSQIKSFLQDHSDVAYVVAPNKLHHLYLDRWQQMFLDAIFVAASGVREKQPDLRFDDDLAIDSNRSWSNTIVHDLFVGNMVFEEVVFYQPSQTRILTDRMLNLKIDDFNWSIRKRYRISEKTPRMDNDIVLVLSEMRKKMKSR